MALIKFGSIITDSRGSIGGHTIKWTRAGMVIQTKATPLRKQTPRQTTVRANFANLTQRWWDELSPTERDDWRALAAANPRPNRWGDEFPLTGLALYVSVNQNLLRAGLSSTDTAPSDQTVTAPSSCTLTATAPNTASLAFAASPVPTDHIAVLYSTPPLSPGVENPTGKFQYIAVSSSGQTTPWAVGSLLQSRFGSFTAGRRFFVSLHFLNTDNGALSTGASSAAIIS